MLLAGNFTSRKLLKSFHHGFIYNGVGFQHTVEALPKQNTELVYKFLAGASELRRTIGGNNFRDALPINVPKHYRGEVYVS